MIATPPIIDFSRLGPAAGARVAVIGGCGGMGRALVRALLDTGVEPAVLDLARSLAQQPPPASVPAFALDGNEADSVEHGFAELRAHWNALDGYVNLAGFVAHWGPAAETSAKTFEDVAGGNLRAHFLCAKAAVPLLQAASGQAAMVNISSTLGLDVYPGYIPYSVAKAGIIAMTKGLAREYAPKIRVNAVAPGLTDTAFLHGGTGRDQRGGNLDPARYARRVPMKRVAEPEDMVGPIMFLLGPAARHITGETVIVDGGVYLQ
jgi:3-oxoacyl-[acyl-carrier protein] reductase